MGEVTRQYVPFEPQELTPRTRNLLRDLLHFDHRDQGLKLSSRNIILPPRESLIGKVIHSESTGTLGVGIVGRDDGH